MKITVSLARLQELKACEVALSKFREVYGESVTTDWTRDKQIETMLGPLGRHLGWAWQQCLLPMWSMDGASLDGARLDGARLNGARLDGASLDGAKICLCKKPSCVQLRGLVLTIGWEPDLEGILSKALRS